jgi:hypothetical protein
LHDLLPATGRAGTAGAEARREVDTLIAAAERKGGAPGGRSPDARVLDRYRLIERLGSGGFGEVWRAEDELLRREVAVKRIPLAADDVAPRAAREAHAAARLSHPAIVALYEAAEQGGHFYLTSELVHGATLARLIAEDALCDEEIAEIGLALCDALAHAHDRGVIHRDVKPQNILVPDEPFDRSGVAKLTDFGGARLAGEQVLTQTGDVLGTLAYMAPEQSEGLPAGAEADLYSLALVLYEAFCGQNPVRAATPAATVRRIGSDLPGLQRLRADLPRELTAAIDRALCPQPQRRGTLDDLAAALATPLPAADLVEPKPRSAWLPALPRLLWIALAIALPAWQAVAGRTGFALLLISALLPLLLVMPQRASPAWLAPVLAPLLGLAGLAAAYPAIAGRLGDARMRAWLAALGFWWLCLAEIAARRGMAPGVAFATGFPDAYPGTHGPGVWGPAGWMGSLSTAATALGQLLDPAMLCGAALWAAGALVLPWVLRGAGVAVDLLLAGCWSAAMLAGPSLLAASLQPGTSVASAPAAAVFGAVLGALLAVVLAQGGRTVGPPRA